MRSLSDPQSRMQVSPIAPARKRRLVMKTKKSNQSPVELNRYIVQGSVCFADGSPVAGMTIGAFDKDLRFEKPLGQFSTTDKRGSYQIEYSSNQFCNPEKGSADLVVKAFSDKDSVLAISPVMFNAPASAEINLNITAEKVRPPSRFEKIAFELKPLLQGSKVKVEDLEEEWEEGEEEGTEDEEWEEEEW